MKSSFVLTGSLSFLFVFSYRIYAQPAEMQSHDTTVIDSQSVSSKLESNVPESEFFYHFIVKLFSQPQTEERVGILEIGPSFTPFRITRFATWYQVNNPGLEVGFHFPFHTPHISTYYKVLLLYHGAVKENSLCPFFEAMNEIIAGKQIRFTRFPFVVVPLIGTGINNSMVVEQMSSRVLRIGAVHYFFYYDIGCMVLDPFKANDRDYLGGLSFHFQRSYAAIERTDTQMFCSLVISY